MSNTPIEWFMIRAQVGRTVIKSQVSTNPDLDEVKVYALRDFLSLIRLESISLDQIRIDIVAKDQETGLWSLVTFAKFKPITKWVWYYKDHAE
jgi:hypothetical protein